MSNASTPLPAPQVEETTFHTPEVPSSVALAMRVYRPLASGSRSATRIALIAHPWGRLGGCMDDAVVQSLARYLVSGGWTVFLFDARGVGKSGGSGSWTGAAEASDYQAIVDGPLKEELDKAGSDSSPEAHLLLAGYSFGSLAASLARPPSVASSLTPKTSYLLVSYPLSVLSPLTLFRPAPFRTGLEALASSQHPLLLTFGTADQFTGPSKYRAWAESLRQRSPSSNVRVKEVEVADHFWSGRRTTLCELVDAWLNDNASA